MDSTNSAVWFAIAVLSISIVVTWVARQRTTNKSLPPVANFSAIIRLLPTLFKKELPDTIHSLHEKFGSVFTINLFGPKMTFLIGPEVSAHFFQGLESEISRGNLIEFTVPMFGPKVGYAIDAATRNEQTRFYVDALKPSKLKSHVDLMLEEVEDYFSKWGQEGIVDLKHELEQLLMFISSRCLLGKEVREKMFDEVYSLFHSVENGISLISVLFPYIPIPAHSRRDRARVKLKEIFSEIIRSRRSSGRIEDDTLQKLIDSKYKDGRSTTEEEITGMILSLLFAGKHSSSHASTWTGVCLLSSARWWSAAIEEQKQIIIKYNDQVDYNVLLEMDILHRCIKEALRMHSPTPMLIRKAHKHFTVQTKEGHKYEIPAEHTIAIPVVVNSNIPSIYKDPRVYDPDRFGPGRQEDKVGGKFSYISFGSGKYACIGEAYAYLQLKIIWTHLLRNFDLNLISPYPKTDWSSLAPGPKGNVMVSYKRRPLQTT